MGRVERQRAAADPDTTPVVLRFLCFDESWRVRAAAASNPKLPEAMLRRLAFDANPRVRKSVARHPSLAPDLVELLASDASLVVRDRIAERRTVDIDPVMAESFAISIRVDLRRLAAASPVAPPASLADLASDPDIGVRSAVAANQSVSAQVVLRLACDDDEVVRVAVARGGNVSAGLVHRLSRDPSKLVRAALAGNVACSRRALRKVAKRSWREPDVLRALAANTAAPGRLLRRLAGHRWDVACVVAANPACSVRLLRSGHLCGSHLLAVRMAVAAHSAAPSSIFSRLARDNPAVRLFLATNPALNRDVVDLLLADRDLYVRGVAATHPGASPEALVRLAQGMTAAAWTLRAIAANPACPADLSDQLLTWLALGGAGAADPSFDPVACSGHPAEPGTNLYAWYQSEAAASTDPLRHPLWRVRAAIPASRKATRYSWLAAMARDIRAEVRQQAARFTGLPVPVLKELSGDAAPAVAQQAAVTLKRKLELPETKVRRRRVWVARVGVGGIALLAFAVQPLSGGRSLSPVPTFGESPLPTASAEPDRALPGGGRLVAGQLEGLDGSYLTVTTGEMGLTVTIQAPAQSLPYSQQGFPIPPSSSQQFVLYSTTPGQTVTVTVAPNSGRAVTQTVNLTAGSHGSTSPAPKALGA